MASGRLQTCGYGLNSHAGYLFERQRNALRQNAFARARNTGSLVKRKVRDENDDDNTIFQQHNYSAAGGNSSRVYYDRDGNKFVLEGLKRMRVTSPPTSPTNDENDHNAATTSAGTTVPRQDAEEMDVDIANRNANVWALVSKQREAQRQPKIFSSATSHWPGRQSAYWSGAPVASPAPPTNESCTALVVFDPYQSIPRAPAPRVELVESDDEATGGASGVSLDDEEPFVRFEELPSDEDEPMEMD